MAFMNKSSDEVIKEAFGEDATAIKAKLAKLDSLEGTLAKTSETLTNQNTLIENLTKSIKEMKVSSPYDAPPQQQQSQRNEEVTLTDWSEDANKAYEERTTRVVAPLVRSVLETNSSLARREAKEQLDRQFKDWDLFADEVDEISKGSPAQAKTSPEFWKNCYFIAKGRHHDEIVRDQNMKSGKFFTETAGASVTVQDKKDPVETLTEQEKKIASGMGLTPEQYAKNKVEMRIQ